MKKTCVFVVGPESSGTRMLTKLFIEAGFKGDGTHQQRWDTDNPKANKVVFRRSVPHSKRVPNIQKSVKRFRAIGYDVKVVVILRSFEFTAKSVVNQKHTGSIDKAKCNTKMAFTEIGHQLWNAKIDFTWCTYEALVAHTQAVMQDLIGFVGCGEVPEQLEVYDGNEKYK